MYCILSKKSSETRHKKAKKLNQIKKKIETLRVYDAKMEDQSIRSNISENKAKLGNYANGIKENSSQISELKTKLHNLELEQQEKYHEKQNEQNKAPSKQDQ